MHCHFSLLLLMMSAILGMKDFLTTSAKVVGSKFRKGLPTGLDPLEILHQSIPALAPYEGYEGVDPLGGLEETRRAYLRSMFSSSSTLYPECIGAANPLVEPVYYWSGEQVALECRMCHEDFTRNGEPKHWAWLGSNNPNFTGWLRALKSTVRDSRHWPWIVLDEGAQHIGDWIPPHEDRMPNLDPADSMPGSEKPKTRLLQRQGRLKILTAGPEAYGLYRCFDHESANILQQVYLLIPRLPLYKTQGETVYCECFRGESIPGFDANHQFRFLLRQFLEELHPSLVPGDEENEIVVLDELKLPTVKAPDVRLFPSHLAVTIHWGEWSACSGNRRTRVGHCHLRKTNVSYVYNDKQRRRYNTKDHWLMEVHTVLEASTTLLQDGLPLFSGVLANFMRDYENSAGLYQCAPILHSSWDKLRKMLVENFLSDAEEAMQGENGSTMENKLVWTIKSPDGKEKAYLTPCFFLTEAKNLYAQQWVYTSTC